MAGVLLGAGAAGLRRRLSPRRLLFLLRVPPLGMASDVFHRRPPRAAGVVRSIPGEGVRGLGAHAAPGLGEPRPRHSISLETVPVHLAPDDDDELRLARDAGPLSHVPAA